MAYSEYLADRIRRVFKDKKVQTQEIKMMGGLCFMVNDKMCVGVVGDDLMARVGDEMQPNAIKKKGCRPMDFTGRPLKGFVFVAPVGIDKEKDLEGWVQLCLEYNPKAKVSKKKKSKKEKK